MSTHNSIRAEAEQWAAQQRQLPLTWEQRVVLRRLGRALNMEAADWVTYLDLTQPVHRVAPNLLGMVFRHESPQGGVAVVITEVEAYDGANDPASHAHRGRTPRTEVMFGPAGHLYVYRSHGLHWCANIVTGVEGAASAVLLRAGRIVIGDDLARTRRGPQVAVRDLTRGPGRLCQALGITGSHNGSNLTSYDGSLSLEPGPAPVPKGAIRSGPRVGVSRAHEVPWRFWIDGEESVSIYRRSPRVSL